MASIDTLAIECIGLEALSDAMALTVEAGWNQTVDDWRFFFAHGSVFGARDGSARVVATAALLPYPADFAWISLVIVAKAYRGRGLGTRMLNACIAALREQALIGVLDATPAGAPLYASLGFKPIMSLKRWQGVGGLPAAASERVRPLAMSDMERIAHLDVPAFGSERATLLAACCARVGTRAFELADGSGYALTRIGRVASQVGPVVAANEADALLLLDAVIASTPGGIFIDVPDRWNEIAARLSALDFAVQRPFLRMALGRDVPYGDPARLFAAAGPEYG